MRAPERGIYQADFVDPTDRYGHDVLGGNEYAAMEVWAGEGEDRIARQHRIELPADRVFEDIAPRLADLTGDGQMEIIAVESSTGGGAELVVYSYAEERGVEKIAATPPIGLRNRWLAPAGIADFDGDGGLDVAYVQTPHIGGDLRIWTLRDGALVEIARQGGFSNHRIGQDFITSAVRDCGDGPELVLPDFGWQRLLAARLSGGEIVTRDIADDVSATAFAAAAACEVN